MVYLENNELLMITLHLEIMKKEVRNAFKRNYKRKESKELMKVYNCVRDDLKEVLEEEPNKVTFAFTFSKDQINMLHNFLHMYIPMLEQGSQEENSMNSAPEETQTVINTLKNIQRKIELQIEQLQGDETEVTQ
ncbi:hypothetical protein U3A55_02350 [Salarchaeum sp. III]|uniref:hypothetical protein n=1 Tax=Salarchaeum sp. III TaxID=3107927 RepID=UPI002EDAF8D2